MDDRPLFEKPLDDLLPTQTRAETRPRESRLTGLDTEPEDLLAIGRGQRALIRWVLVGLVLQFLVVALMLAFGRATGESREAAAVVGATGAVVGLVTAVVFARFARRLYSTPATILLTLLALVFGVLVVLVVNGRATEVLRRNGIRVGLLGARRGDLARLDRAAARPNRDGVPPIRLGW